MIKTENLCMRYGPVQALNDVNFEIAQHEVIGLLGPNGAGKSTTLKILTTYIYPTQGTAYVAGYDVRNNPIPIRKLIGYLPEQLPLYMDMEVSEYLTFVGRSRGLYGATLRKRLEWVKEKCGIGPMFHKIIRELSKGYRQRTALAQALLHDPEIVILDEPTSGLDPHQIIEIRALIHELAQEKTMIFSTHILQEVQAVTNRIIVLNRGKIVANGTFDELQMQLGYQKYELILPTNLPENDVLDAVRLFPNVQKADVENRKNGEITYLVQGPAKEELRTPIIQMLKQKQWDFLEIKKKPFTLEEIFLQLTEPAKE